MPGLALNFFPLESRDFDITLYIFRAKAQAQPTGSPDEVARRRLPTKNGYQEFWTSTNPVPGAKPIIYDAFDNVYATIDVLRQALIRSCRDRLKKEDYEITGRFRRRAELVLGEFEEGRQVMALEPYLLRSMKTYGFLANFHFRPTLGFEGTRRALELSLSLDRNGDRNINFYADRYAKLAQFVDRYHRCLFPLEMSNGSKLAVRSTLDAVDSEVLDVKRYVLRAFKESRSQYMGVKQHGPLTPAESGARLYFLYRPQDKPLSHDLYRALRGDTFRTFPGMETMFGLSLSGDSVSGTTLESFDADEILRVRDRVEADASGRPVVPVVITPFSRHDDPVANAAYWDLKHAFLSRQIPIQVVSTDTIRDKNKLKWSASGIGLQIFAKAGGTPWKVRPRNERCLIVGIGQAHKATGREIEKYFAYSVLTDSSGVFEEVRILGEGQAREGYLGAFAANLRQIFEDYRERFQSMVIHATFAIRQEELRRIEEVLQELEAEAGEAGAFVSMKFNDRNRFFGFATDHNSKVPFESTVVSLSRSEHLVWFEGLQFGKPTVGKMVSGPVHIAFNYPRETLNATAQRSYLQDAINLSGANWRGFNAKSLPVSVYYAQLIARYTKEFDAHGLPPVDVSTLKPWFL